LSGPTLPRCVVGPDKPGFDGPFIVKPRFGGSSIGIEVVEDWDTACALAQSSVHLRAGAIAEPFRDGAVDIEVAIRTHPAVQLSAISKPLKGGSGFYGYAEKYTGGEGMAGAPRELPAQLPGGMAETIRAAAETVVRVAGVRGVARLDFLLSGDELVVNEINTIPGSLAFHLWVEPKVPFAQLLGDLLDEARARPTRFDTAQGADGTALRAAGSIASKLG
jgi:D-alanine-D-alanine ligase